MRFRRDPKAAIDNKIKEAMQKPLTADNLNYIGDLYLRKGEKELTIECLFNAISKLHASQWEKMIALYKKIIKLSPSEEKAYTGLIGIFSKMGLAAEEVKYLTLLARLYQSRGDYEKVNPTYRRVIAIEPENELARKYFDKGKQATSDVGWMDEEIGMEEAVAALSGLPEIGDLREIAGYGEKTAPPGQQAQPARDRDSSTEVSEEVPDAAPLQDLSAGMQEFEAPPESQLSSYKRVYLGAAVAVLFMLVAGGMLVYKRMSGGGDTALQPGKTAGPAQTWIERPYKPGGAVEITVSPAGGGPEEGPGRYVSAQDMAEYTFYSVTVKAGRGCIPPEFASDPAAGISFIGRGGARDSVSPVRGLEKMSRTINKSNVPGCGEDRTVFMKLYIAHPKGQQCRGIAVKGIEKGYAETITWQH